MATNTNKMEEQFELWDEAERAAAAAAELNAAIVRATQSWADATATAVCQVTSAGFASDQTWLQVRDILLDEAPTLLRETAACHCHAA